MKSLRGKKNILNLNSVREAEYLARIDSALSVVQGKKIKFNQLSDLIAYVVGETGIHRTTFIKNKNYRAVLNAYPYLKNPEGELGLSSLSSTEINHRLMILESENSNLRASIKVLQADAKQSQSNLLTTAEDKGSTESNYFVAFTDTSMALLTLLDSEADTIELKLDTKTIERIFAKPSEKVIVGPSRLGAFFEWYYKNIDLIKKIREQGR